MQKRFHKPEVRSADLKRIRHFVGDAREARDPEELARHFLNGINQIVSNDNPCWNTWCDKLENLESVDALSQYTGEFAKRFDALTATLQHHPIVGKHSIESVIDQAHRLSDFESDSQFQENPLYREVYRHVDARHQLAHQIAVVGEHRIIATLNRQSLEFTERELQCLEAMSIIFSDVTARLNSRWMTRERIKNVAELLNHFAGLKGFEDLSASELRVTSQVLRFKELRSTAESLNISIATLDESLGSIREKVGLSTTKQLRAALLTVPSFLSKA